MDKNVIFAIVGVVVVAIYVVYYKLVIKNNNLKEAMSGVDVQLKLRYDLIPNMLKSAAKFMEHERSLFEEITKLRESAMNAKNYDDRFKAENSLDAALRDFNLKAENYPELKSDSTMVNAQKAMAECEEHIAAARRFYNSAVKEYKNSIEIFPFSLIAMMLGFKDVYPFFEVEDSVKENIDVNAFFNNN